MFLLMVLLGVLQTFGKDTLSLGAYYFGSKFLLLFSSDYSRAVGPKSGNSEQRLNRIPHFRDILESSETP